MMANSVYGNDNLCNRVIYLKLNIDCLHKNVIYIFYNSVRLKYYKSLEYDKHCPSLLVC